MAYKISVAAANAALDALGAKLNNGYLRLYSGTRPATVDTALAGNTLLAELRYSATAFGAAAARTITANAIAQDSAADAAGTATFFRAFAADGTTAHLDGDVGTSGADLNLNTVSISANGIVQVTSQTVSM